MGGAMLTGWLARGLDPKRVVVIEPHPSAEIEALAAKGIRLNPTASDTGEIDTLVVAVKPQSFGEAGAALKPFAGSSTLVVSIMAGTPIATIKAVMFKAVPGGSVVRAMPNTPAAIGRGITVAVAAKNVSAAQRATADALLRATGAVEWVDSESLMDAVTAGLRLRSGLCLPAGRGTRARRRCGRPAGGTRYQTGARDRGRFRRVAASLGTGLRHLAPERDVARRYHRGGAGSADGTERHADAADPRGSRRDAALEGPGEVIRLRLRCLCEERSDEAIHTCYAARWIASLALAKTIATFPRAVC